jgi:phosphoglucomutase
MLDMYVEYGLYKEELVSITKKGKTGAEEIKAMMEKFRNNPPVTLGGSKVATLKDYELGIETDLIANEKKDLGFPKSDVLQFITEDGSIISARPSGTEPKIKFYCSVNAPLKDKAGFKAADAELSAKVKAIMNDLEV